MECIVRHISSSRIQYYCLAMNYFAIICVYLRMKLKNANTHLKSLFIINSENNGKLFDLICSLYLIYDEIESYNDRYWSKYLFALLLSYVSICSLLMNQIIFAQI